MAAVTTASQKKRGPANWPGLLIDFSKARWTSYVDDEQSIPMHQDPAMPDLLVQE